MNSSNKSKIFRAVRQPRSVANKVGTFLCGVLLFLIWDWDKDDLYETLYVLVIFTVIYLAILLLNRYFKISPCLDPRHFDLVITENSIVGPAHPHVDFRREIRLTEIDKETLPKPNGLKGQRLVRWDLKIYTKDKPNEYIVLCPYWHSDENLKCFIEIVNAQYNKTLEPTSTLRL